MKTLRLPRSPKVLLGLFIVASSSSDGHRSVDRAVQPERHQLPAQYRRPRRHHWFGTTSLGQDIFSQLLVGARATMVVALSRDWSPRCLMIIGVAAGYLGGLGRRRPHLLSNVFLAIPGCRCSS
jgi:ABC-type dipeptide/oligopeptide/nickel transport system permease subunit